MFFINKEEINLFLVTKHQIPVKCPNKYLYLHNCEVQVREISTEIFVLLESLRPLPFGSSSYINPLMEYFLYLQMHALTYLIKCLKIVHI